ncbi:hypothetical protein [Pseudolysinimonas sp.]|uniref:hypothetical protein n=1 Tax=Pseudolysinimonas sp. TaxID=2680009 RepID=UPI0037834748
MPAVIAVVILALLAVFQLALAAGAPLGHYAWGGQHRVLPRNLRIGSVVSIAIYALIAAILLGLVPFAEVGRWVVFAYFVLGIVVNAISRSKPERYVMTPVVTALAVLSLLVALG